MRVRVSCYQSVGQMIDSHHHSFLKLQFELYPLFVCQVTPIWQFNQLWLFSTSNAPDKQRSNSESCFCLHRLGFCHSTGFWDLLSFRKFAQSTHGSSKPSVHAFSLFCSSQSPLWSSLIQLCHSLCNSHLLCKRMNSRQAEQNRPWQKY